MPGNNFMEKINAVKWSQRFVLGVVILIVLALLIFIFNVILTEGLSGILNTIIGAAFIVVFFRALLRMFHDEWDTIKVVDEELTAEIDPRIVQLESQLEEEKRKRREVEDELEETKRALREVKLTSFPSVEGFDLDEIVQEYDVVIVEKGLNNPFQLNADMVNTTKEMTAGAEDDTTKAKLLFDWMQENIQYDFEKLREIEEKKADDYKDSIEVLEHQTGVCGEQAILYIAMARTAGLTANYVSVTVDHRGESVSHACTSVSASGRTILVDPAYHAFDIQHQQYEILTDEEATRLFKAWDQEDAQ